MPFSSCSSEEKSLPIIKNIDTIITSVRLKASQPSYLNFFFCCSLVFQYGFFYPDLLPFISLVIFQSLLFIHFSFRFYSQYCQFHFQLSHKYLSDFTLYYQLPLDIFPQNLLPICNSQLLHDTSSKTPAQHLDCDKRWLKLLFYL